MKHFIYPCADYYIGTAREVKTLYKNLYKKTAYWPLFTDEPVFNMNRMYGIEVNTSDDSTKDSYFIISELDCMYLLLGFVDVVTNCANHIDVTE